MIAHFCIFTVTEKIVILFRTSHFIPVDLNCFMEKNGRILSEFFSEIDAEKSSNFRTIAERIRTGVDEVTV